MAKHPKRLRFRPAKRHRRMVTMLLSYGMGHEFLPRPAPLPELPRLFSRAYIWNNDTQELERYRLDSPDDYLVYIKPGRPSQAIEQFLPASGAHELRDDIHWNMPDLRDPEQQRLAAAFEALRHIPLPPDIQRLLDKAHAAQ